MFPDGAREGLYHTADATLWFFHAVERYVRATGDTETLERLLPTFADIVRQHIAGTRFGIGVDPADGLLRQGEAGYQLTWMDAKVDDWVVTPRRGKAVEINALWYNALRLLEGWTKESGGAGGLDLTGCADRAHQSFNRRFWSAEHGHLYDVVDGENGDDASCRPNQVFAISLDHPVLDRSRWEPVMQIVRDRLLTPVGLRSLAPGHADYKAKYYGDLRARDAAYHQGTVWAWLIGPFVGRVAETPSRRSRGRPASARGFRPAPRRSVRRVDRRSLRRRRAVRAARVHRPGVERRRGAAMPAEDSARSRWHPALAGFGRIPVVSGFSRTRSERSL